VKLPAICSRLALRLGEDIRSLQRCLDPVIALKCRHWVRCMLEIPMGSIMFNAVVHQRRFHTKNRQARFNESDVRRNGRGTNACHFSEFSFMNCFVLPFLKRVSIAIEPCSVFFLSALDILQMVRAWSFLYLNELKP